MATPFEISESRRRIEELVAEAHKVLGDLRFEQARLKLLEQENETVTNNH